MLCDFCHQDEAIIHIQEITPDGNKTFNLCAKCAMEKFAMMHPGTNHIEQVMKNIMELFKGKDAKVRLEKIFNQVDDGDQPVTDDVECPTCHKKLSDFAKTHTLGCQECAQAFANAIRLYIERALNTDLPPIQEAFAKSTRAQAPADARPFDTDMMKKHELARLQRELDCSIKVEDYERAAKIRDLIAEFTPVPDSSKE